MYKHIYFDLDRTLWDFERNSIKAFEIIFDKHKLNKFFPDFDSFVTTYKKHNEDLWAQYREGKIKKSFLRTERFLATLKEFGLNDSQLAETIGNDYIEISPKQTILFPNTHELLSYLKEKSYKLYIITNGFKEVQYDKLNNNNLSQYFDRVFTSEEVGHQKPHPEIFSHALKSVNAKKSESLMIGDDFEVDIIGAKKFGMDQVFFNPDNGKKDNMATFEIQNLIELKKVL